MKFWKSLNNLIEETLPDWRDKFLSYKDLKKQLKSIYPKEGDTDICNKRRRLDNDDGLDQRTVENDEGGGGGGGGGEGEEEMVVVVTKEVNDFVNVLEDEMEKFNGFFVEKEEEYVITWKGAKMLEYLHEVKSTARKIQIDLKSVQELQDRVAKAKDSNRDLMEVGREIVDFHGEMVLLENYSALNYTGLVKILKKYDKRSGALIRLPFIQKIIQQPFFSTDLLKKLVKECETVLDHLFSMNEPSTSSPYEATVEKEGSKTETANENGKRLLEVPNELSEIECMESMYGKLTLSALRVLKEIRSGSSTVSVFSLPPLQTNLVEDWKKVPVLEQAAK